jgi:C4-dicarboxylate transporter DctM subunit
MGQVVDLMSRAAGGAGAGAIALMMFLTAADVLLRYLFNWPIPGSFEITEYLMAIAVSTTLAYCAIMKGHVRVEIIVSQFSQRVQTVVRCIVLLLGVGFFSLLTWQSAIQAENIRLSGSFSSVLRLPDYPFVWVLFVGSALIFLVFLGDLYKYVAQAVKEKRWTWVWLLAGSGVVLILGTVMFWGKELPWRLDPSTFGLVGVCILVLLLFSGLEIGLVIGLVGALGMAYLSGGRSALTLMATVPYSTIASYSMSIIPLFILMGTFCFYSGLSEDLFWSMNRWLGRLRGGLAMATVAACAGFAAVSGSSLATTATLGKVALPEMKKYKYDDRLATGSIAAGGTIGILIPPSGILVIYAILTELSIGELFLAGFIPGVLEALFYMATIYIMCKRNPRLGPTGAKTTFTEKLVSLKSTWGVLALFFLVMGAIYTGLCSPTEAAGVGAFGAFLFALSKRRLTWQNFIASVLETGKTTAMIFLIVIGSMIFSYFLAVTRLPFNLAETVVNLGVNRYFILSGIILVYLFLGAIMGATGMILLTVPIFYPVVTALGFDPIWFGIIIVRMCEIGGITPPVGMNVYIMAGIAKDVPLEQVFKGIIPFLIADFLHLALLIFVPQISLFLPNLLLK